MTNKSNLFDRWDEYFYLICQSVASKSPCLSRKIGAILVRDKSIISTGYNGPPRGVPHCGHERFMKDRELIEYIEGHLLESKRTHMNAVRFHSECPRRIIGYESGTHMELCPAQHAEENAVSNAARNGVSTLNCTLYMNSVLPCKNCIGTLINAGIKEIVVEEATNYDKPSSFIYDNSLITIRTFCLEK